MKKIVKMLSGMVLGAFCCFFISTSMNVMATTIASEEISVKYYLMLLEKALGREYSNPVQTAVEMGLIKEGEFVEETSCITNEQAAVLANRADIVKQEGNIFDMGTYEDVKYKKRISDIGAVQEKYKEDVYQVFTKGIMIGDSNGMYAQNRKFSGKKALTRKDAFAVVKRVEDTKKRKKISPDGQVIRTTNLPKNYKDHRYILESFPNGFYEKKFEFQGLKLKSHITANGQDKWVDKKLVELKDFARPVKYLDFPVYETSQDGMWWSDEKITGDKKQAILDSELDMWTKKIEKNLKLRLNVNYRTINNKWYSDLRKTYSVSQYDEYFNKRISEYLKDYIEYVKLNQIKLESRKIVVEPSTLYYCRSMDYIRCYVEFRLVSAKDKEKASRDGKYIFTTLNSKVENIETGKWISMYLDIPLSSAAGCEVAVCEYSPFIN